MFLRATFIRQCAELKRTSVEVRCTLGDVKCRGLCVNATQDWGIATQDWRISTQLPPRRTARLGIHTGAL